VAAEEHLIVLDIILAGLPVRRDWPLIIIACGFFLLGIEINVPRPADR
jgi:hypothetical protein